METTHCAKYGWQPGYCGWYGCSRCSPIRANIDADRLVSGAMALDSNGYNVWFMTMYYRSHDLMDTADLIADFNALIKRWKDKARYDEIKLIYAAVLGYGGNVTDQHIHKYPHYHILINWIPEHKPDFYRWKKVWFKTDYGMGYKWIKKNEHPHKYKSDWLLSRANTVSNRPVELWIELPRVVENVARYCAKNIHQSAQVKPGKKTSWKVRFSRNWPKPGKIDLLTG